MEDHTFKRILQDKQTIYIDQSRAEGNNTECVTSPFFGQGTTSFFFSYGYL